MFFSSPSADLRVIIMLLVIALIISLIVYVFSKKALLSVTIFSVLGNLIFYGNVDYNFAEIYDIFWIFYFSRNFWPYLNLLLLLILIISYLRKKYANFKQN